METHTKGLYMYTIRPRKIIPVFTLTCSKILGSVGRKKKKKIFKTFSVSFYRGHILTW